MAWLQSAEGPAGLVEGQPLVEEVLQHAGLSEL